AVEQRHEELEVRLFAVVRRSGQQQEVPREAREQLAEPVALSILDLAAEEAGGHFVCLVHHDEIPVGLRQLRLGIFVSAELIEPADSQVGFGESVTTASGLKT